MASREPPETRRAPANDPQWLTLGQAAKYLGVAQSTLRKWSDREMIQAFYTPGRHRRYRRNDLDAFLERSGPGMPEPSGPIVLIVDDDAGTRAFVRASLEAEGFEVREAASAPEGLAALEGELPDLVLLDVMMPQMDGWEMLRRVQEKHDIASMPVIMFSGKVDAEEEAAARGATGFMAKPSDPQQLVDRAKQILGVRT
jgi:excisionase family DNA binding protein